jgi:hypothetical protein
MPGLQPATLCGFIGEQSDELKPSHKTWLRRCELSKKYQLLLANEYLHFVPPGPARG